MVIVVDIGGPLIVVEQVGQTELVESVEEIQ